MNTSSLTNCQAWPASDLIIQTLIKRNWSTVTSQTPDAASSALKTNDTSDETQRVHAHLWQFILYELENAGLTCFYTKLFLFLFCIVFVLFDRTSDTNDKSELPRVSSRFP